MLEPLYFELEQILFEVAQESNMPPAAKGTRPFGNPFWEFGYCGYAGAFLFLGLSLEWTISKVTCSRECRHEKDFCSLARKKAFLWRECIQTYMTEIKKLSDAARGQKDSRDDTI